MTWEEYREWLDTRAGCPGRLCSLHPCRYSNPDWTWLWETTSNWSQPTQWSPEVLPASAGLWCSSTERAEHRDVCELPTLRCESEQAGDASIHCRPGAFLGWSVFMACAFPSAGRHGWECPAFCTASCGQSSQLCVWGSSPSSVYAFYNKQPRDKTKQDPSKIILGVGMRSQEPYLTRCPGQGVTKPFSFIPWHCEAGLSAAPMLCLRRAESARGERNPHLPLPSSFPGYSPLFIVSSLNPPAELNRGPQLSQPSL